MCNTQDILYPYANVHFMIPYDQVAIVCFHFMYILLRTRLASSRLCQLSCCTLTSVTVYQSQTDDVQLLT
jgi:hypothetical protein